MQDDASENDDPGLGKRIKWDTTRGRNFQCLAQVVYCCENEGRRSDPTAKKLFDWLSQEESPSPQLKKRVERAMQKFLEITSSKELNKPFVVMKHKVSPIEFVFIGELPSYISSKVKNNQSFVNRHFNRCHSKRYFK